ncbi:class 1 alpha-mannosidase 1a [Grosmannia clavigera kw1407]|uniref:alpha-1,2-Mannosidase n=1 Tax=Grosmannia clavigera (strain kw1407 / UAMH 11150) TaxID=655863 RepID=F0XN77_GROCL|nr:class 1 alpha-mannosidase 1a [Grosmannia clavigera kw1407]EFX00985.1 class 1 alpha-mannosidase 1a [Grosmannia clavigera kw1407]
MLRFRRYRLVFYGAVISLILFYHISRSSDWGPSGSPTIYRGYEPPVGDDSSYGRLEADTPSYNGKDEDAAKHNHPGQATEVAPSSNALPAVQPSTTGLETAKPLVPIEEEAVEEPPPVETDDEAEAEASIHRVSPPGAFQEGNIEPSAPVVHWNKTPEHFPVPVESLIQLPTGVPAAIPRIQYDFGPETQTAREAREARLFAVRDEMTRAWHGYRTYAWAHDELAPLSKTFRDPFCGWAASLVDAMDTLWIMGLRDDFDDAYEAVKKIDFTTTPYRPEIPVFETIIRYLGGLIAAYDVSGGKAGSYPALLDKAVELAEVLMSVFDTPNRMPILYYRWAPESASQARMADTASGIAELGSMTMEFTRLAQLTGQNKYYDAIARIVNALEEWQSREGGTAVPGIFPEHVDASGCNRTAAAVEQMQLEGASRAAQSQAAEAQDLGEEPVGYQPLQTKPVSKKRAADLVEPPLAYAAPVDTRSTVVDFATAAVPIATAPSIPPSPLKHRPIPPVQANGETFDWECRPQNLTTASYGSESYSMGGSQDSTYEYFPKQYLLLGGLVPKYRTMHEKVVAAVKKYLLYRPMIEDEARDILFSARVNSRDGTDNKLAYTYEVTHLTCFLGGMFAMGGRIFNHPEDVEIGAKLADGCAWAYEVMPAGIMPEFSTIQPCARMTDCPWNQTLWYDRLDPSKDWRAEQMAKYKDRLTQWEADKAEIEALEREEFTAPAVAAEAAAPADFTASVVGKRDVGSAAVEQKAEAVESDFGLSAMAELDSTSTAAVSPPPPPPAKTLGPKPKPPLTHEEYVAEQIKRKHLQPGFDDVIDRRYILRPEAIESVWYMYRITGDPAWQEKGWRMFKAVIKATQNQVGHSAINDVTVTDEIQQSDSMESFWFSETLKYFYLLFAPPDVVSLDDWVLNTEAHPFRRPT